MGDQKAVNEGRVAASSSRSAQPAGARELKEADGKEAEQGAREEPCDVEFTDTLSRYRVLYA